MTKLLYLQDTYLFKSTGTIKEIGSNELWDYIILDRTIFYPQGWGQPSDTWIIKSGNGEFQVEMCKLDEHWSVFHYGVYTAWEFIEWEQTCLQIDSQKRIYNARNHSAGHLVDVAIEVCWYNSLQAWKGFHFPEGSYVEYHWELSEEVEVMKEKLTSTLKELSHKDIPIMVHYEGLWELAAPAWKTPRFVEFQWYTWCWCGGTHVKNSWEIGWVSLRKIKYKKWILRVSYSIK